MDEIKEGTFYKSFEIEGVKFEICYGYEFDGERERGWEPSPIYPDFTERPRYTPLGQPFASVYQEVCKHYEPIEKETDDDWCANCKLFDKREEFIGLCKCPHNRERKNE